jgi:hypothetical protein
VENSAHAERLFFLPKASTTANLLQFIFLSRQFKRFRLLLNFWNVFAFVISMVLPQLLDVEKEFQLHANRETQDAALSRMTSFYSTILIDDALGADFKWRCLRPPYIGAIFAQTDENSTWFCRISKRPKSNLFRLLVISGFWRKLSSRKLKYKQRKPLTCIILCKQ